MKQKSLDSLINDSMNRGDICTVLLDFTKEEITQYALSLIEREEFLLLQEIQVARKLKLPTSLIEKKLAELSEQFRIQDVRLLQSATGKFLKHAAVSEDGKEHGQEVYNWLIREGKWRDAGALRKSSMPEVAADEGSAQKGYSAILSRVFNSDINSVVEEVISLFKETNVKPIINESLAQELYLSLIKDMKLGALKTLWNITDVKIKLPDEKALFSKYLSLISSYKIEEALALEEIVGIQIPKYILEDKKVLYNSLKSNVTKQQFSELVSLCSRYGISLDNAVSDFYMQCLQEGHFDSAAAAIEKTGIKPETSAINEAYCSFVRRGDAKNAIKLKKAFKSKALKASAQDIQQGYSSLLTSGDFSEIQVVAKIGELIRLTRVKPDEQTVQAAYRQILVKKGNYSAALRLYALTKVKPNLSEDEIQAAYKKLVSERNYSDLNKLKKITGAEISEDIVMDAYRQMIIEKSQYDKALTLYARTKVKPNLGNDEIQAEYKHVLLSYKPGQSFRQLAKLTGAEVSDETALDVCRELIAEKGGYSAAIRMYKLIQKQPNFSEEEIQAAYKQLLLKNDVINLNAFKKLTGAEISDETAHEVHKATGYGNRQWVSRFTGVKPDDSIILGDFKDAVSQKDRKYANYLYNANKKLIQEAFPGAAVVLKTL